MSFYHKKGGVFDTFFKRRDELIDKLENGELSKKEFLDNNYMLIRRTNMSPFLRIDSCEMGLYNYQYYNVLAKYFNMLAGEAKELGRDRKYIKDYANKRNNYYNEKDKCTLALLKFLDFKNMEAYYINTESESLDGSLFEIVLLDYNRAIFHSKSKDILKLLEENGVFQEGKRESKIHEYINEKY